MNPVLLWLRQDLRLSDHPALLAAITDGPVIPVYVLDDETPADRVMGAAQRWWLHHSLSALDKSLHKRGSALILRRGKSADALRDLAAEVGALRIHAHHHYEPWHKQAEAGLAAAVDLLLHDGNYLAAPKTVLNGQGQRYRMFTPWYRRLQEQISSAPPLPAPDHVPAPTAMPRSDALNDWGLLPVKPDWSKGFSEWQPGEKGARRAAQYFLERADAYHLERDLPCEPATSRLSPHLHFGEISPRSLWHATQPDQSTGAATFRTQIAWREHGLNLVDQFPGYHCQNGRPDFDRLEWRSGAEADEDFAGWAQGLTGYPVVDAGMRQLWQTGWMHNRVRMIAASFLVKHLLIDWRRGERWFWDTLLDADMGANAMNWQYVGGTGVDAPMFSRIMSPRLQSEKFDMADYVRRFVPEIAHLTDRQIHEAHSSGARVSAYPQPIISHEFARARALAAWSAMRE